MRGARVFREAVTGFFANDCPLAAAAIAYFVMLSLFPLVLLALVAGTLVLPRRVLEREVLEFMGNYVAGSGPLVRTAVHNLDQHLSSVSALALVGVVWSGLGIFGALRTSLNLAWGVKETRSFWEQRRVELQLAAVVTGLFVTYAVFSSLLSVGVHGPAARAALGGVRTIASVVIAYAGFLLVYELVPNGEAGTWGVSARAAVGATVAFALARWVFLEYLASFANYSAVYGALAAVVVFLVWAYACAVILLFFGHVASRIELGQRVGRAVAAAAAAGAAQAAR